MGALNIKDQAVAEKARRLARLKGTSITAAVDEALEESLRTASSKGDAALAVRERRIDGIVKRFRSRLKRRAPRPDDVISGLYDEHGSPK